MAIATYSDLQDQVAAFLNREDLSAQIPVFITLAEADLNRMIRHYNQIKRATSTIEAGEYRIAQPVDWLEAINIQVTGASGPYRLKYVSPSDIDAERYAVASGEPRFYSLIGSEIEVSPTPAAETIIEQIYYAKITPLSVSAPTNWLLTKAPDAYLYGALLHSAPYLDEDPRLQTWNAGYARAVLGLNESSSKSMTSGGALTQRARSFG